MPMPDSATLSTRLQELDLVPADTLAELLKESQLNQLHLSQLLVDRDILSDKDMGKLLADMLNCPFVQLSTVTIDQELLMSVPESVARAQHLIVYNQDDRGVHVAMLNPHDTGQIQLLTKKFAKPIVPFYTTTRELEAALSRYHLNMEQDIAQLLQSVDISKPIDNSQINNQPLPIVDILNLIFEYAYHQRASDIHFEPEKEEIVVRFRIDGVLEEVLSLPITALQQVVSRIKVMAKLRTDEQQAAQDGKITYSMPEEELDMRVSIVPVTRGEKIVIRLLSAKSRQYGLLDLGLSPEDRAKVEVALSQPHGLLLSTGPTGSGKTTTLYAILKLLNSPDRNIMTIEDPVEYDLAGINQIQVNEQTNLTFADGLRSIIRQDPDVVLVGEIRDADTAGIAVNAAMTGHLVLSTLHTNNAATTLPRLLDMDVEAYLVASTVSVIIGQRLVRTVCQNCRVSEERRLDALESLISPKLLERVYGKSQTIRLYKGKGCPVCHHTGFFGRIGIFEVLVMDDELRAAVTKSIDAHQLEELAIRQGMTTMLFDGLQKAARGLVTIEEVLKVTKE